MLKAYLHNKLSGALRKSGMTDAERAALSRSEDALTSSVMGQLAYLDGALVWRVLSSARPVARAGPAWPAMPPVGEPEWRFWPRFDPHPAEGGERVEPDVLLVWGGTVFVIEAKHHGQQDPDGHQWRRQLRAVGREHEHTPLVLIGLGGTREDLDRRRVRGVNVVDALMPVPIYRLDWRDLRTALDEVLYDEGVPRAARRALEDAAAALDRGRHFRTRGLATLPEAVSAVGTLAGTTACDALARDRLAQRSLVSLHEAVGRIGSLPATGVQLCMKTT